ncbi:hypothetical protein F5Y07DRAFT_380997 [Xylaria sp. FL0933]|nr:hypothetical protein F5Y07DRAFT_380997 [Xylaria sp. FL0933]
MYAVKKQEPSLIRSFMRRALAAKGRHGPPSKSAILEGYMPSAISDSHRDIPRSRDATGRARILAQIKSPLDTNGALKHGRILGALLHHGYCF